MHKKRGDAAALSTHTDSQLQHDATADAWNSSATGRFGSSKSNVGSNDDEEHQKKASYEEMRRLHRVKQTGGPRRPPAIAKQVRLYIFIICHFNQSASVNRGCFEW